MRILLLEDDAALRTSVAAALRARGNAVDEVDTLPAADERFHVNDYDVAVLDRGVPGGDGIELARRVRMAGITTPILFLTARDDVEDRVDGLDAGGDDYLVKPFAMAELLARVRSLGRRAPASDTPVLTLGDLQIDPAQMIVTRGGKMLTLTLKEFTLLAYLVRRAGHTVSRTELLEHCWDEFADPRSNVVDVRVRLLRAKLGEPPLVHTIRGAGYLARS